MTQTPTLQPDHTDAETNQCHHLRAWQVLLLVAFGASMLGIGLGGDNRVLTYHEAHFAQPAREMLYTGDWVLTRYGDIPFKHKPPLTQWLIALSMLVTGTGAEWAVRMPIVLAAIGIALLTGGLAAAWYGSRTGLIVGLVQLTPYYMLMQARLAEADIVLCLMVTAAMTVFALACLDDSDEKPKRYLIWLFYALAAGAFMAKFVIALAFIFGGCGLYILVQRDWRALRALVSPAGWLIFLALALPWPMAIYQRYPGIVGGWIFDNVDRFSGELNHDRRTTFYYLYMIPAIAMPWTLWLVPGAVAGAKQGLWRQKAWRFLLCWVLAGLALLSMSAFKHKHYAIPILPPLSIIAGWFLANWAGRPGSFRVPALPAVAGIILGAAAIVATLWIKHLPFAREGTAIALLGGATLAVFAVAHAKNKPTPALAGLLATLWIGAVGVQNGIIDHFDSYRSSAEFAHRVAQRVPAGARLHLADVDTVQEVYYLPLPMTRYEKFARFQNALRQGGPGEYYLITPCRNVPTLQQMGAFAEVERFYRRKSEKDAPPPPNSPDLRVFGILTVPAQATTPTTAPAESAAR